MKTPKTFELKPEHLLLLKNANVQMQDVETGAPEIDPKRPYGNSFVAGDVAEILGRDRPEYRSQESTDLLRIHYETLEALQIILQLQTFEPGIYRQVERRNSYDLVWERVK